MSTVRHGSPSRSHRNTNDPTPFELKRDKDALDKEMFRRQDRDWTVALRPKAIENVGTTIRIVPTAFWKHVKIKIDDIYAEKDYPFECPKDSNT